MILIFYYEQYKIDLYISGLLTEDFHLTASKGCVGRNSPRKRMYVQ
jgi:hypothetical protein